MGGWKRIGIVLSIIWFLGFGVYLFAQPSFEAELHKWSLHACTTIYQSAEEDSRKFGTIERRMPEIEAARKECIEKATLTYERIRPSDYARLTEIIVVNLVSIALAWLVVGGCVSVVRWIRRGFLPT